MGILIVWALPMLALTREDEIGLLQQVLEEVALSPEFTDRLHALLDP